MKNSAKKPTSAWYQRLFSRVKNFILPFCTLVFLLQRAIKQFCNYFYCDHTDVDSVNSKDIVSPEPQVVKKVCSEQELSYLNVKDKINNADPVIVDKMQRFFINEEKMKEMTVEQNVEIVKILASSLGKVEKKELFEFLSGLADKQQLEICDQGVILRYIGSCPEPKLEERRKIFIIQIKNFPVKTLKAISQEIDSLTNESSMRQNLNCS